MAKHLLELEAIEGRLGVPFKLTGSRKSLKAVDDSEREVIRADPCIPKRSQSGEIACSKRIFHLGDRPVFGAD